ncbi:PREDICTED: uncharacterized protein LOC105556228 [Vollenhovia emeryi]|uniref:uncharacterized protein LOC105556228 n=1 Tax=Vollenhovia emeryi TaxID=411798 RepID=UPI0005F41259|nr:PREDICTED: uncharacterized protein LOC105556228 [Vollenhovia emeryi]
MGEQFSFTLSGYKPDQPRSHMQKTILERRKSEDTRDQLEPRVGSDWDDEIPEEHFDKWRTIYHHLTELNNLELPRWIGTDATATLSEIHGFADASSVAYAAVVYLKTVSKSGKITISLLTAKSKVAPVKPLSIPRLELSAAVLLSRLICFVQCSLRVEISRCVCWTDSTIVLAWLKQHPSQWKTFVANRVSEVQTNVPAASWRHVPTQGNPADCASRGLLGRDLKGFKLWWQGPNWLRCSPDNWPTNVATAHSDVEMEHKRVVHSAIPLPEWDLIDKFSSWLKLIRVTAYIQRFISRCRGVGTKNSALTSHEIQRAKVFWLQHVQSTLFSQELNALKNQCQISKKSALLSLHPFLDEDGLLRVGGRLKNAPIPFATRHPIVLASHPLVSLLIQHIHIRSLHAGLQLTLATLRREYWVVRARTVVKAILFKCVTCTREKASSPSQLMGDLPVSRVTPPARSFQHCGIDYAGPVVVRTSGGRGVKSKKAYIALFVCLASRAIHLELVGDYTTSAFLDAFSRFCARRGLPESMHSDNGTTFVGADRELQRAYQAVLRDPNFQNTTASDRITWHFLPPSAPHFGGLWETGVKSVKYHLRRVLKSDTLTFEEFSTLLCRIEACLNSRPLAPIKDTPDDYNTLTPGHFLIGSAVNVSPEPSVLDVNENRLSRWQRVRQLTEGFWCRWQDDYINTLQQRSKWRTLQSPVKVGQFVLLKNSTLPPCKWELGRITQCHTGADGLVRVVTVKTAGSEFKRPIVKICCLPVDIEKQ